MNFIQSTEFNWLRTKFIAMATERPNLLLSHRFIKVRVMAHVPLVIRGGRVGQLLSSWTTDQGVPGLRPGLVAV